MKRIQLLDEILTNQIAAGEVVERPCAVVKELIENALDAKATRLDIVIERGGLGCISITDNGYGIHPDDLLLAVSRHATSKIHCLADLQAIMTLGFRGEALASIASVSHFRLLSRTTDYEHAMSLTMAGQVESLAITPCAHPVGTTVEIRDLFFNTPARRHFLRAEKTEFAHIVEVMQRVAISHSDVAFTLTHNGKSIFSSQESAEKRLARFFGHAFIQQAQVIDKNTAGLRLRGWLGAPEFSRSQMDMQYFYLNGRVVRDKLLQHAIREAYAEQLPPGRHAMYVLFLEVDAKSVDVNVHPTKQEVRFREARFVHDFLVQAIMEQLGSRIQNDLTVFSSHSSSPTMQFPSQVYRREEIKGGEALKAYQSFYSPSHQHEPKENHRILTHLPKANALLIQTHNSEIALLDLHAVFSCSIAHYLLTDSKKGILKTQPLLIPSKMTLSVDEYQQLILKQPTLQQLGIDLTLENNKAILNTIPALLARVAPEQLLAQLVTTKTTDMATIAAELACSAIPQSHEIITEAMLAIALKDLAIDCRCAHGRQAMVELSPERIEQWITV